jgi:hypothetical protein
MDMVFSQKTRLPRRMKRTLVQRAMAVQPSCDEVQKAATDTPDTATNPDQFVGAPIASALFIPLLVNSGLSL